ncbi:MAG: hypothetical protein EBV06_16185 [Planctomycetia bacterium]|nr:hypothetical protein [Planctomycetia bacterium]
MIEMPPRSITRFFVPMIDVLTLLFCIYLLMPLASDPDTGETPEDQAARELRLRELEAEAAKRPQGDDLPAKLREELERLKKMNAEALRQRLTVRVLEVDGRTGKLYYREPDLIEIAAPADARRLIARDRETQGTQKELYYLILCPRDRTSVYPTREDRMNYRQWFDGVALGYDEPGATAGRKS